MEELRRVCEEATYRTHPNPPGGEDVFDLGVEDDLYSAAEKALREGANPAEAYDFLFKAYSATDGDLSWYRIERLLLENGLHPDAVIPGSTCILHLRLSNRWPPPCRPVTAQRSGSDEPYLDEYLALGPDPNLTTSSGGTALHLMVSRLLNKQYWPDLPGSYVLAGMSPRDLYSDGTRAEYLTQAFPLMLEAGYSPTAPDRAGRTVVQLLKDGYNAYGERARSLRGGYGEENHLKMQVAIRTALKLCGEQAPAATGQAGVTHAAGAGGSTVAAGGDVGAAVAPADGADAPEPPRMPFGKHKDWLLSELPASYIEWMCGEDGFFDGSARKQDLLQGLLGLGLVRMEGKKVKPAAQTRKRDRSLLDYDDYDDVYAEYAYAMMDDGALEGLEDYDGEGYAYGYDGLDDEGEEQEEEDEEEGEEDEEEEEDEEGEGTGAEDTGANEAGATDR